MFALTPMKDFTIENCNYTLQIGNLIIANINALETNTHESIMTVNPTDKYTESSNLDNDTSFVLTTTVIKNLELIAQSISLLKPVLLEGTCSAGKTTLVTYLASKISKNGDLKSIKN